MQVHVKAGTGSLLSQFRAVLLRLLASEDQLILCGQPTLRMSGERSLSVKLDQVTHARL